ncbi:MAG: hypothetical protein ACSHXW_08325 [Yoonia sp.]
MKKVLGLMAVAALLAACNDRSAETVDAPDGGATPVPPAGATASLGDVDTGSLEGGVLTVQVRLDGEDTLQEYAASVGDVNGYDRFDQQQTALNRAFSAIAGTSSANDELVAVVTMDGGQFNRFFGGATLEQGDFSAPASGFSYYNGNYAGLVNIGAALPPGGGAPGVVTPGTVGEVIGQVYLVADFTDNAVEGAIFNRQADFGFATADLPEELVLINTDIDGNGRFSGTVEQDTSLTGVGTYSGAFGGTDAIYVGGIVALGNGAYTGALATNGSAQGDIDLIAGEGTLQEYGLFIIGECDPSACFTPPPPPE